MLNSFSGKVTPINRNSEFICLLRRDSFDTDGNGQISSDEHARAKV